MSRDVEERSGRVLAVFLQYRREGWLKFRLPDGRPKQRPSQHHLDHGPITASKGLQFVGKRTKFCRQQPKLRLACDLDNLGTASDPQRIAETEQLQGVAETCDRVRSGERLAGDERREPLDLSLDPQAKHWQINSGSQLTRDAMCVI